MGLFQAEQPKGLKKEFLAETQSSQSFLSFLGALCASARNYNLFAMRI
jgi:hypothetical protein